MYASISTRVVLVACFACLTLEQTCTEQKKEEQTSSLVVETHTGYVEGIEVLSSTGKLVDAFLGIPYAAPPTNALRFKTPLDIPPWQGVYQAKKKPVSCFQAESKESKASEELWWVSSSPESEDCLYLNLWVPRPRPRGDAAVLVWIHGGSFLHGSSTIDNFDGTDFASEEGIIVMNMNYRLSAFGFLYLNHSDAPGNVGLMDQEKALTWVYKNARQFGGDPKRVTIMGHSTGALCAGIHFLRAGSSSHFLNNAILAGGTPSWQLSRLNQVTLKTSLKFAEKLGCPSGLESASDTIECLLKKDPDEIVPLTVSFSDSGHSFYPILDGNFIREDPDFSFKTRTMNKRALIVMNTREEGAVNMLQLFGDKELSENTSFTRNDQESLLKKWLQHPGNDVVQTFRYLYDQEVPLPEMNRAREQMIQFATDLTFLCPTELFLKNYVGNGGIAYQMIFSHGRFSSNLLPTWAGTFHGEELPFLFGKTLNDSRNKKALLSRRTIRYIANFVKLRYGRVNLNRNLLRLCRVLVKRIEIKYGCISVSI